MGGERTSYLGQLAEKYSSDFLSSKGYKIIFRNYRKPWGEIDIIAEKEGIISFVEVKANKKEMASFEPELRANREKIKRVVRTARTFLLERKYKEDQKWQIDILSVVFDKEKRVAKFRHYKNIDV